MKDEHQIRLEALRMTFQVGGLAPSARTKVAHEFEQYVLNGYTGEAKPAPQAPAAVPATEGKDPPKRRARGASEAPASSGEASKPEEEGDADGPIGRPSSRVSGALVQ